jgi:hypothetical protein
MTSPSKQQSGVVQTSVMSGERGALRPETTRWFRPSTVKELEQVWIRHFSHPEENGQPFGIALSIAFGDREALVAFCRGGHVLVLPNVANVREVQSRLQEWLEASGELVVGFNFGRIAAIYRERFFTDIRGVDLFSLRWFGDRAPTPGCCAQRSHPGVDQTAVDAFWDKTVHEDRTSLDLSALCIRAWISSK